MSYHFDRNKVRRVMSSALCIAYSFLMFLPMHVVRAQEVPSTDPVTAVSEPVVETPATEPVPEQPVASPTVPAVPQGPQQPPGPDNPSYTWNPEKNVWESKKYTWDPATKKTAPKEPANYSYNPETNRWDTVAWVYAPEQNKYIPQAVIVQPAQPATAQVAPSGLTVNSDPSASAERLSLSQAAPTPEIHLTDSSDSGSNFDLFFDASISTTHSSHAASGNAAVLQNTYGGNALSGNALAMANIINMVQSVWGWQGLMPEIYTANIQGDHYGDILINPSNLGLAASNCECGDIEVNAVTNGVIENNVNLAAQSGNALVSGNTTGGNATSGSAAAIANIINMIHTSMTAGQSFVGQLNINGSLEGDILIPEDLVDQLIASNVPSLDVSFGGDTQIKLDDNTQISNNVNLVANSGNAIVDHNTNAGSASTGNAETNLTVFNLTNRSVIGNNALLVFVNVGGRWVGFITDAPEGATAAMLGGGVTENSACNYCGHGQDQEVNANTNSAITNNVNLAATSGNAEVSNNTTGGSASTGDARAMANISNITSSNFSFGGWFGILFINILNDWLGSFGTNTLYGNPPVATPSDGSSSPGPQSSVVGASTSNIGGPIVANAANNQPRVRAYSVEVQEDEEGKIVLASASEIQPPIIPKGSGAGSRQSDTAASVVGISLVVAVFALAILLYGDKLRLLPQIIKGGANN